MAEVILAAFVLGPAILTFLLKSNAALAFLALCASFAVVSFAGTDLRNLTGHLNFSITGSTLNLIILTAPLVLTLLIVRHAFSGGAARVLHLIIALCAGGLLALIAVPLLNGSARDGFSHFKIWTDLQNIQSEIVGAGAILSLLDVWVKNAKKPHTGKKKK